MEQESACFETILTSAVGGYCVGPDWGICDLTPLASSFQFTSVLNIQAEAQFLCLNLYIIESIFSQIKYANA